MSVKNLDKGKHEESSSFLKDNHFLVFYCFKIKHICVYPGKRLSLQSQYKRSEHWVIVKGNAKITVGKDELILQVKNP